MTQAKIRIWVPRMLRVCMIGIAGCHQTHVYTPAELGCGAGAYAGQPAVHRAAQWPDPSLALNQRAGLFVGATDVASGRAAVPLNIWISQGADTVKLRTTGRGEVEVSTLVAGPAEVRSWFFNFAPTRDSITLRGGFRDSVVLRLGRTGQECDIAPDSDRRTRRRQTGS